ncbi:MAG: hypothetical protein HKN87_16900 [Saprospiraceae bacterium]|nr:hypothetical protein [Saprospiraceae bacterium]
MEQTLIHGKPLSFYLRQPNALKRVDKNELKDISNRFPYNTHLHLLIAIKDHLDQGMVNQELLEKAALYIADRRRLGEWMNKLQSLRKDDPLPVEKEEIDHVPAYAEEPKATGQQEDFSDAEDTTIVHEETTEEQVSYFAQEDVEEQISDEELADLIEKDQEETTLVDDVKEAAIEDSIHLDDEDKSGALGTEEEKEEPTSHFDLPAIGAEDRSWQPADQVATVDFRVGDLLDDDNAAYLWDAFSFSNAYFDHIDEQRETPAVELIDIPDAILWNADPFLTVLNQERFISTPEPVTVEKLLDIPDALHWNPDAFLSDFHQRHPEVASTSGARATFELEIPDAIFWNSTLFITNWIATHVVEADEVTSSIEDEQPAYLWNPVELSIFEVPLDKVEASPDVPLEAVSMSDSADSEPHDFNTSSLDFAEIDAMFWDPGDLTTFTDRPSLISESLDVEVPLEEATTKGGDGLAEPDEDEQGQLILDEESLKPIGDEDIDSPFIAWLQSLGNAPSEGYHDLEQETKKKKKKKKKRKKKKKKKGKSALFFMEEDAKKAKKKREKKKKKRKKKKKKSWKKDSLLPDEALVSEALAELLAKQGHKKRAIQMYEKLRLIIPEKSVFFAQKIAELQKNKR